MLKKLTYTLFTIIIFFIFSSLKINAKEYCHLHLDNEIHDTIELPFYYYQIDKIISYSPSGMPIITHNKNTTYVDSLTKCTLINDKIIYNDLNLYNGHVVDYSKEEITLNEENHFNNAKIKINGSTLIGLSTKKDEEPPIISGYETNYTTNINSPLDLNLLIKNFSAYDNFDGNISSKIKIEYNQYSNNLENIGVYPVILSIEDTSLNKTTITIYIEIIDTTPPTISGENMYTSYLSSPITIEEIKKNLSAKDNTNQELTSQIFVCQDLYSTSKETIGIHYLFFCVYDKSNNLSNEFKVTIEVKDDIPPIIEGLNYYDTYLSSPITAKEITYSLAASDNNKDISTSIFITKDLYTNYINTIGTKKIYFQAMDESNNLSLPFEVTINLIDDIKPQIFGLNIFTSYLSSPLSITHIKQQLTVIDNIDGNITSSLEAINDSYTPNINNKGTFYLTLVAKDSSLNHSEEFKVTITTIDDIPPYIIGESSLTYKLQQKPSLETILNQYEVKDNVDKNLTYQVQEENYSSSIETGTFFITLNCLDSSNNIAPPFIIKINIVEELINIYNTVLYIPTSTFLKEEEINKLLNFTNNYKIIENTYYPNHNTPGTYTIKYELQDNSILNITITTFNNKEENTTIKETSNKTKKETFFTKIKRFFSKIFNYLKNIFTNLIIYPKSLL